MVVLVSTAVLVAFFIVLVAREHRSSKREVETLKRCDETLARAAEKTRERYHSLYGKDPTQSLPVHNVKH